MATRPVNFGAGPAKLPEEVLDRAQLEMKSYGKSGVSVMEMSHRSKDFKRILEEAEGLVRELMEVPASHEVLFLQGGATGQFAGVPLNLGRRSSAHLASYAVTGTWSDKAAKEAARYLGVHKAFPALPSYTSIPDVATWNVDPESAYLYYCVNETVHGVEFPFVPSFGDIPLVGDISSKIMSRRFDVGAHGVLVAGVQKNLGPAGLTIGIVRKDLMGHAEPICPSILNYHELHKAGSIYNTPPVWGIYMTKLVMDWIKAQGGVSAMEERNSAKSKLLYSVIDSSEGFYRCPVEEGCRSRMNVPFRVGAGPAGEALEEAFVKEAEAEGMISLKGHRSVGGIRASLYNAVTLQETRLLTDFMHRFLETHNSNYSNGVATNGHTNGHA